MRRCDQGALAATPAYYYRGYAWQGRAGEAAPNMPQLARLKGSRQPDIDVGAASTLVERYLPDAFITKDRSLGMPMLVLSADGKVSAAGRLKTEIGTSVIDAIREQLLPTYVGGSSATERITNSHGDTAVVNFYWDSDAPKAADGQAAK